MIVPSLVNRLEEILDEKSISVESFADCLGFTVEFVKNLMSDMVPNVLVCLEVARILNLDVEDIWFVVYDEVDL